MNRVLKMALLPSVILMLLLFASCASRMEKRVLKAPEIPGAAEMPGHYTITDYKNKGEGGGMPEWVSRWLEEGASGVEALDAYKGRYAFISRNEGSNLNALTQWAGGFSSELDFPRLAAARIERRFLLTTLLPDGEYGAFFETLIRAASDASWTGALREDDFWIRRKYLPPEEPITGEQTPARENWEFLILVTIEKNLFASQFDSIFQSVKPSPPPAREQINAANRVKDRFYDGF